MSYKNKTYVIFDGDEDIWAYRFMKGWKSNDNIDFDFLDAHDLKPLTNNASEETVKSRLRERFSNTKQVIVLIGEKTKNLYRFVRWEIDLALAKEIPIVAVNLNAERKMDSKLCPPILKGTYTVHVPFKMKIIKYALDNFPSEYKSRNPSAGGDRRYNKSIYEKLGLENE